VNVAYCFDPSCPWTWRTSRWLCGVAPSRGLEIEWRSFSLLLLNDGEGPPKVHAAARALRVVEALRASGSPAVGRFYTEIGARTHEVGAELTDDLTRSAAAAAEVDPAPLDDPSWDGAVRASHDDAFGSAGPDIGSPVLLVEGASRGVHGPILASLPEDGAAVELWDTVVSLARTTSFYELKRGRR